MSAIIQDLFKLDGEPDGPPRLASHRGGMMDHARISDEHAAPSNVEVPYVFDGNFAKLFGARKATRLFAKSAELRERLRAAMGDSADERDDLLAAFLSSNESAARLAIRRALREDFPKPEKFVIPEPDSGPRELTFDEFLSQED